MRAKTTKNSVKKQESTILPPELSTMLAEILGWQDEELAYCPGIREQDEAYQE